jgi:DNA topoisomerase-1
VVERDAEIAGHTARNYWQLRGSLGGADPLLGMKADGEYDEATAKSILKEAGKTAKIKAVKERLSTSAAPAPLITSTLQQEASALHGLGPKQSMAAAQKLYEAGHITYMRTDNPQLSVEACQAIRDQIRAKWGEDFVGPEGQHQLVAAGTAPPEAAAAPAKPTKGKKAAAKKEEAPAPPEAQAAHEAIRPTHTEVSEIMDMEHSHQVVYRLIWRRAMQSQMAAVKTIVRTATLEITNTVPVWTAEQTKPAFDGWRAVEQTEKSKETAAAEETAWTAWTPLLTVGSTLNWATLNADEVFTKPPGRYTEATLIRELERRGIGRPSTFASLVTTLFEREYVEKTNIEGRPYETRHLTRTASSVAAAIKETKESHKSGAEKNKVRATPLGVSVTECLQRDFQDLFAYEFTAQMEGGLDSVSNGAKEWKSVLQETWDTYKDRDSVALAEKGEARTQTVGGGEVAVKVVQTKRGPLLVRPKADGSGDEFAPLPPGVTAANAATKLTDEIGRASCRERVSSSV